MQMLRHPPAKSDNTKDEIEKAENVGSRVKQMKEKIDGIVNAAKTKIEEHRRTPGVYSDTKEMVAFIEKTTQEAFDEIQKMKYEEGETSSIIPP
jgi:predicted nuclease with TOPRIM domain